MTLDGDSSAQVTSKDKLTTDKWVFTVETDGEVETGRKAKTSPRNTMALSLVAQKRPTFPKSHLKLFTNARYTVRCGGPENPLNADVSGSPWRTDG